MKLPKQPEIRGATRYELSWGSGRPVALTRAVSSGARGCHGQRALPRLKPRPMKGNERPKQHLIPCAGPEAVASLPGAQRLSDGQQMSNSQEAAQRALLLRAFAIASQHHRCQVRVSAASCVGKLLRHAHDWGAKVCASARPGVRKTVTPSEAPLRCLKRDFAEAPGAWGLGWGLAGAWPACFVTWW